MAFEFSGFSPMLMAPKGVKAITAVFTGGGAATDCTKVSGTSEGVTSLAYNAATGKYLFTFDGVAGKYLGALFSVMSATGASAALTMRPAGAPAYDHGDKTLAVEVTSLAATPALADLATTEEVFAIFFWQEHGDVRNA
jgi:hypothetical protein